MVTSIDLVRGADDLLILGTLGRGAWTIPNASQSLDVHSTLTLLGDGGNNVFNLVRNASRPWLLDVYIYLDVDPVPATPTLTVPFASLESITIDGRGGNDQLIVDATNGAIAFAGGIVFKGGAEPTALTFASPRPGNPPA